FGARGRAHHVLRLTFAVIAIFALEVTMSQSGRDHTAHPGQSQSTNHSPRRSTPPPPVTNITNFLQNPEFIQGLTSLIARAMPRNSITVPLSMSFATNPTEHPNHTRHDPETHAATSHATSQPHHTSPRREELTRITVNPVTNNQAPEEPPVQEMTAESHSAHHQRVPSRPRPTSPMPHVREDLQRQIERNRISRHSAGEIETFKVLDVQNEYNAVIGRTALYKLRAAVSIFHYALKFPTIEREDTHYGDQREARSLTLLSTSRNFHMIEEQDTDNSNELKNLTPPDAQRTNQFALDTDIPLLTDTDVPVTSNLPETLNEALDQEQSFHEKDIGIHKDIDPQMQFKDRNHHARAEPVEEIETIYVDGLTQEKSLRIGANLQEPTRSCLIQFLQSNSDVFAWKHEDMKGIDPQKACHRLNLDKTVKPVIQKRRKFGPDRQKALKEKVNKLIDNKFIKEAKYPTWISNPVLVKKATGLWRLCIDFSDLNQACPKDSYPIPHIDYMVDATSGHQLMSFLDAYSSYNQIPMHPNDAEHTSFYSARGLYYYVMMTFGLKNAGATYQRLVNKMFSRLIGHTMEVYVDDMLVKSEQASDHIAHLSEVLDILREYSMVLNPKKCTFGVRSGKFLGYMVSQRGIEANPAKIQAILELAPPTSIKGVQALTGRLAALNRFISKSTDHCKSFFDTIRKKKPFEWTVECQNAFDNIKEVLSWIPTLQKPLPDEPLYLYLGVSDVAVSAVLIRQDGLQQFPIYYVSKALHDAELRYPYMEKFAFALIIISRKLRPYFMEHSVIVFTSYPLRQVLHRPDTSGRMIKWAIELGQFDIQYRPRTAIKAQVLFDFIAEFTPIVSTSIEDPTWTLYIDGSSTAIQAGGGIVLVSPDQQVFCYSVAFTFPTTNNEAEYEALLSGLHFAESMNVSSLRIFSNSQLLVSHINGTYEVKEPRLLPYFDL
ncbi:Unknown protein, partial [Striga hermonthica]